MNKFTKEQAIKIVVDGAKKYKKELLNKNLLILCHNKQKQLSKIELSFSASNYMHLTGLKMLPSIDERGQKKDFPASVFFDRCLNQKLSPDSFVFADDGTTHKKLEVLPLLISKNLSAKMIGNYNSNQLKLSTEKLAGNNIACMGFVRTQKGNTYVPNTVLKADIRDYTNNIARVIAVFRKEKQEQYYSECTYKANKFDWDSIKLQKQDEYLLDLFDSQETDRPIIKTHKNDFDLSL